MHHVVSKYFQMASIIEIELPGLSQKVRVAQTKSGYLVQTDSLCRALFLDPSRLDCDSWMTMDESISLLFPFMNSHPAVRAFLRALGEEGLKAMFPNGLTLAELSMLVGVSEEQILADMPTIMEKIGR